MAGDLRVARVSSLPDASRCGAPTPRCCPVESTTTRGPLRIAEERHPSRGPHDAVVGTSGWEPRVAPAAPRAAAERVRTQPRERGVERRLRRTVRAHQRGERSQYASCGPSRRVPVGSPGIRVEGAPVERVDACSASRPFHQIGRALGLRDPADRWYDSTSEATPSTASIRGRLPSTPGSARARARAAPALRSVEARDHLVLTVEVGAREDQVVARARDEVLAAPSGPSRTRRRAGSR